ncbi:MAG: SCP2 sterol-binding domain-containing protein [Saprospiraceae bacterium]|nr:SCP2 sterol-binding domain-containing protein [Saprospiraceae bacterium]
MSFSSVLSDIQGRAANASPIGSSIKFDFGDEQRIYIDGTGENNIVTEDDKDAAALVLMKLEDMEALLAGKLNPMMAFMSGKLKVKGDMGVAMKLQSFLG